MDKITAIIPVKKNSTRLPNKNILPFADSNLLTHKIRQLKKVSSVSEIVVSSDSEIMLKIAKDEGAIPMPRPLQYANETLPISDFVSWLGKNIDCDHFMWSCVTSPLVETERYSEAIRTYLIELNRGFDSLITVLPFKHYLMDDQGPFNFKRGRLHPNSQNLHKLYLFTNGIQLTPHDKYIEWGDRIGEKPYYLEVTKNESIDIDDIYDYKFALSIYSEVHGGGNLN